MINELLASLEKCTDYCNDFPFSPVEKYPEYPFSDYCSSTNDVYDAIRNHFVNLGLDSVNYGTPDWNPLGEFNLQGKRIIIKPNWVMHCHPNDCNIWSVITHPSIIRVLLDYIYIATNGNCEITIGDSPLQKADFEKILSISRIQELQEYFKFKGLYFGIEDFRIEKAIYGKNGNLIKRITISDNPKKFIRINLFDKSFHSDIDFSYKRYRVTTLDKRKMRKYHMPGFHEYLVSSNVIKSDFFINIPKAKTHKKAGVTLSLKNLIGINCIKDSLPHHRRGRLSANSDEYEKFYLFQSLGIFFAEWGAMYKNVTFRNSLISIGKVFLKLHHISCRIFNKKYYSEGGWYGNDTIWRTCLDLNKIILYSDQNGKISHTKYKRNYLTIIDGIVGGEKEGPLEPTPISACFTVAAFNPAVSDFVAAQAMGLDPQKIPIIKNCFKKCELAIFDKSVEDIKVLSTQDTHSLEESTDVSRKRFEPSAGWKNHIELTENEVSLAQTLKI